MSNLQIDTDSPVDSALVVDNGNSAIYQHGGVATKITYDRVTVEPVADLLKRGIDTERDKVTLVRLDHAKRAHLIEEDTAITYEGCSFSDVPLNELAQNIKTQETREFITNIQYPIVAYISTAKTASTHITVALNNYSFEFRDRQLGFEEPIRLYMPPLWFGVDRTGDTVTRLYVAVVTDYNGSPTETALKQLPLPNIYSDGHICTGSSRIDGLLNSDKSDGAVIANSITRFFCSNWNTDLTDGNDGVVTEATLAKLKDKDPELHEKFVRILNRTGSSYLCSTIRCIAAMSQPNGWMDMHFKALGGTTKRFLGCVS